MEVGIDGDRICPGGDNVTYRRVMKQGGRCDAEQGEICCGTGRFRGMAQVWSGEELWRIGGYNCPQVRGEISPALAYVLRASLKTQFPSDFWNFVGFIPLALRRLGR